jgi:hypothetical protein
MPIAFNIRKSYLSPTIKKNKKNKKNHIIVGPKKKHAIHIIL